MYAAGLDELYAEMPYLDGVLIRIGEAGRVYDLRAGTTTPTSPSPGDSVRAMLTALTDQAERVDREVIFRTWSVGVGAVGDMHTNDESYEAVLDGIDLGLVEFTTHAGILGPLAGEQESQPGRRVALGRLRRGIRGRGELFGGFGRGGGDDSEPVVEVRTAGIGAEADVSQGKIGLSPEVRLIAGGQLSQGLGSFGRQGQNVERAFGFRGRAYGPAGCFFQDDMGIGAAHAEGTDAGQARFIPGRPGDSWVGTRSESSFQGMWGLGCLKCR